MIKQISSLVLLATVGLVHAQSKTFTIGSGNMDARQNAAVESQADFEDFVGRTHKVSGAIQFDPKKKVGSGKIKVDLASIDTGIALRNDHMKSPGWLDTAKFPEATFEATSVKHTSGDSYTVTGKFTIHGVTKVITAPVTLKYRAANSQTKAAGFGGDVIQVSTKFPIKLSDYGIKVPSQAAGKVANRVTISLSVFASDR